MREKKGSELDHKTYLVPVHVPNVLHHGLHQAPGLGVGAELEVDQVSALN